MKLPRPISRHITTYPTTHKTAPVRQSPPCRSFVKEHHAHLIRTEVHTNPYSISHVLKSYTRSPQTLDKARLVFNQINGPTLLLYNYMLCGMSISHQPKLAIEMYHTMYHDPGVGIDNLSLIYTFKACGRSLDIVHGMKFHGHALSYGYRNYSYVSNALICMYSSCGYLDLARNMFDEMCNRDLVSWNSLICGYFHADRFSEVLDVFYEMGRENLKADKVAVAKVLLACSVLGDHELMDSVMEYVEENDVEVDVYLGNTLIDVYGQRGLVVFARTIFDRMLEKNVVSWNAMITGHAKAGDLKGAKELFDEMPERDVISWTSMITGYCQSNQYSDAIRLFKEMIEAGLMPDKFVVSSVLSACAHLGKLDEGKMVHECIQKHDVETDIYVGNSLIDMYCKCGLVDTALEVFEKIKEKNSVSWTTAICGFAVNGYVKVSLDLFSRMLNEGVKPTHGTFVGVLLACAHAGKVDAGMYYFESMKNVYKLEPEMKHYGCVVDLLSRSGDLNRAYQFIEKMPVVPDVAIWRMLLNACNIHGNVVLANIATHKLLKLDPSNSGNYVLPSITYAGINNWIDATRMRELMKENHVKKPLGSSSLEINCTELGNAPDAYKMNDEDLKLM